MDHIDAGIIRCLTKDARMNASQISQQVNLSVSAVIERMKKLEASGLIKGYTAVIDERLAGYGVQAMICVCLEHPKYGPEFVRQIQSYGYVKECYYVTGDFDYLARICAASTEELTRILYDIKQIPGVSLTHTYVVLENIKQSPSAIPDIR